MKDITAFQGEYRFLSNFWPCQISWDGLVYPSLEHAYAAAKTDDPSLKEAIRQCPTPGEAKEYLAQHRLPTSVSWAVPKKLSVMEDLLFLKFGGKEPFLTRALMATGEALLVEGNTWHDTFWGVYGERGENNLGKLLMKVRARLFEEKKRIQAAMNSTHTYQQLAEITGIAPAALYQKMLAFGIPQHSYLGYQ